MVNRPSKHISILVALKSNTAIGCVRALASRWPHPLGDHEEIGWWLWLEDFFAGTKIQKVYASIKTIVATAQF